MERALMMFSALLLLFIVILNVQLNKFDSNRKEIVWNLNTYWREFVTSSEYKENDFFVINKVPEKEDFFNWILDPHKKTFFVLKTWKTITNLVKLPSDINWLFDKELLFKQENNWHIDAFRSLFQNTRDVCTMNETNNIICRNIDWINK